MQIIINEIKKIFNLRAVLLMIISSLIIFEMFVDFQLKYFPNGSPNTEIHEITEKMLEKYGVSMDETEFEDLKLWKEEMLSNVNEIIASRSEFRNSGITTYQELQNIRHDNEVVAEEMNSIMFKENIRVFWDLEAIDYILDIYGDRDSLLRYRYNPIELTRINEIIKNNSNESILTWMVFENYNFIMKGFALMTLVAILFMLCPIFIKDRINKVEYLQYTSKEGRKIYKKKIIAGLISTIIITTLLLAVLFGVYKQNNTIAFFDSNINSIFNSEFWYDITFIEYIGITVILIYILAIVTAIIAMFLSSKMASYITLIGIAVPVGGVLLYMVQNKLLTHGVLLYESQYKYPIIYLVLILVSIGLVIRRNRKLKRLDILY